MARALRDWAVEAGLPGVTVVEQVVVGNPAAISRVPGEGEAR